MKRVLLIDGDVLAYKAALACEQAIEWAPGYWTWNAGWEETKSSLRWALDDIQEELDGDETVLCLTDPERNWRLDVLDTYKTHRRTVKKPLLLLHLKEWMQEELEAVMVPGLEGDDVMGILSTRPKKKGVERIIVSIDKDMKTIPGKYVRTAADVDDGGAEIGAYEVSTITRQQADDNWMRQTLSGDATDGYGGCPGVGDDKAQKIVSGKLKKVPYEHTFKSGQRKGETVIRYTEEEAETVWEAVVSHYEAAGLTEDDAITQARVARILRDGDYDYEKKEVNLWHP